MNPGGQLRLSFVTQVPATSNLTTRQINILRSPKKGGTAADDSQPYLDELGVAILDRPQPIQFLPNTNERVHRWSPYVQGFSAGFVQSVFDTYKGDYGDRPVVLDPFAGSGTVIVQAKLNHLESYGVELNPLLQFIAATKIDTWDVSSDRLTRIAETLPESAPCMAPAFLKSSKQFNRKVLQNLERLKGQIDGFVPEDKHEKKIKNLLLLAFSAILIDCSNLKRSPCLGYNAKKRVDDDAPYRLFRKKIRDMADDLNLLQKEYGSVSCNSEVILANSAEFQHERIYDLIVTSPPYMNGLDYVMNYKIEMGWLNFADSHKALKQVKNEMVVCDNVSKGLIRKFAQSKTRYTNPWIEQIKARIEERIAKRGRYRREDMPEIVHKYFDDMHQVMSQVVRSLRPDGRFILVVGDSLIADVYLPTDLLLARIGQELGLRIEKIEKARDRRSGQIRSYKLRETILTLRKGGV